MTGASQIALVAIPVAIGVKRSDAGDPYAPAQMPISRNIWHYDLHGRHAASGDRFILGWGFWALWFAFASSTNPGDWFAKDTRDYFGPRGISLSLIRFIRVPAPVAVLPAIPLSRKSGLNRIHFEGAGRCPGTLR